ncbi:helicase-related protein [Nitrospirillum viridazoti]|uniref:RNA helicase n=1 Tax=Nitrospirillum viridazoti CBAmc TaxID=1441467 RepID=A0A248K1N5_9PROT|nr:helicase-related protein [Nitrospirillum amazonense]ASG24666.1 RNA helicase [Nitrospirillum amazonense CBAmc]TWB36964.1 ATP-dependent RNA helicase SUPV3L1/SUV3 [Nitrospirillum amazonense]
MTPDTTPHVPDSESHSWDPDLLLAVATTEEGCATLAQLGLVRPRQAAAMGLVPLPLVFPDKEQVWVEEARRDELLATIQRRASEAVVRPALLAAARPPLREAGFEITPAIVPDRVRVSQRLEVRLPSLPHPYRLNVDRTFSVGELSGLDGTALVDLVSADGKLNGRRRDAESSLARRLAEIEAEVSSDAEALAEIRDRLWRATHHLTDAPSVLRRWEREVAAWAQDRIHARGRSFVDSHFDLKRYEDLFPQARSMPRRLVLVVGPTNSGKTRRAMQALKDARSGAYLAPLRLLALEIMDRLNKEGVAANLVTGEEEIRVPGARITASTVEMLDPESRLEVAVIDEVQMLADAERGWAWSAALVGVPAETVYLLGSPDIRPVVERMAQYLGEPLEVVELERKTPLKLIDRRLEWSDVQAGDALIAFSRREVHSVRETIRATGLSAAVIYGALAPEVRRREAERFTTGEADVVVATDAIGMGLNLPVRRVLFTSLEKFDGHEVRPLSGSEVRQIAGRAGRYGKFEVGEYGVVGRGSPNALRHMYKAADEKVHAAMSLTLRPTRAMMERLATYVGTDRLVPLVDCFAAADTKGSPYALADLTPVRKMAVALDARRLDFDRRLTLLFMPADLDRETDADLVYGICRALEREQPLPLDSVAGKRIDSLDDLGLEAQSRICDLYYWATRKFSAYFPDREAVTERRAAVAERLAQVLAMRSRARAAGEGPHKPKPGFRGAPRKRYGPKRK